MRNSIIIAAICGIIALSISCQKRSQDEAFSFDRIYYYAIQEDVKKIVDSINSLSEDSLSVDQLDLKRKYNARFLDRSEVFNFNTNDTLIIKILSVFQNYWTEILMKENTVNTTDEKYKIIITNLLLSTSRDIDQNATRFDFRNVLNKILKRKGYFTRIDRTGNIMDLIAWSNQTVKIYDVKIQDTVLKVPVVLIDSVLTFGWEGFATFNHFYPGGWATPDTLFCITKDYDLNSEKFVVSYLTHETQHLYDSKTYSGYSNWIAEYRAKLAALAVTDSTTYDLLGGYIKGNKNDRRLPHPYAEYKLIKGLSDKIFKLDFVTDIKEWEKVSSIKINEASKQLLQENSRTLKLKKHSL
jgi:hypothetical protein